MYGYVNNSTGEFYLFRTFEEAGDHAQEQGLTRVTVRSVRDYRRTRPGVPAGGAAATDSFASFLALGQ